MVDSGTTFWYIFGNTTYPGTYIYTLHLSPICRNMLCIFSMQNVAIRFQGIVICFPKFCTNMML